MPQNSSIDHLVRLIYEAAADPSRWNDFLSRFAAAVHAPTAVLLIHDEMRRKANYSAGIGADPAWHRPYQEHFAALNPWTAQHTWVPGIVETGEQILTDDELVRTEFYN